MDSDDDSEGLALVARILVKQGAQLLEVGLHELGGGSAVAKRTSDMTAALETSSPSNAARSSSAIASR